MPTTWFMRGMIASSKNTSKEILVELSKDEDYYVRMCIAMNTNTPKEILENLSKDKDYIVRYHIAKNINTPVEILTDLSNNDKHWLVRSVAQLTKNQNCITFEQKTIKCECGAEKANTTHSKWCPKW